MAVQIQDSKTIAFQFPLVAIMAPMGYGKTRTAATAEEDPSKLLWLMFDNGGIDSLADVGTNVKVLDFSTLPTTELLKELKEIRPLVRERVATGQTTTVVADSVSVLDKLLVSHFAERLDDKTKLYNAVLTEHTALYTFLKSLSCRRVALFHEKVIQLRESSDKPAQTAMARTKLEAEGLTEGKMTLDISGQAPGLYRGNSSLVLAQQRVREGQGYKYYLSPNASNAETRARFSCLADREPAHLGQLFGKIRAHLEKVNNK